MTIYEIKQAIETEVLEWIQTQPNLINIETNSTVPVSYIKVEFNHTQPESIVFEANLAKKLFTIDGTEVNTARSMEEIQADSLMYITELSITKTNVGTSFVDLYNDYGGRNFFTDLTSYEKIRYHINWNINGSVGTHNLRVVDNGNVNNVLFDIVVTNGQNIGNATIPDPLFKNFRGRLRIQVKSTTANDDPICDRIFLHKLRAGKS